MPDRQNRQREEKLDAAELNRSAIQKKIEEDDTREKSEFEKKASNFWYYNKWKVIIGLFLLIVVVFCTCQMCSGTAEDARLLYAGSCYMPAEQRTAVENICATYIPEDATGDGAKCLALSVINVYSDSQVEALNAQAASDTGAGRVNNETNQNELKNFDTVIVTGEYAVCILEPWLYERVAKAGGFCKLADVLGSLPENAYSEFALLLSETAVYKENPGLFDGFAPDTLICLRTQTQLGNLFGNKGSDESYAQSVAYFKALVLGKQ